MICDTKKNGNGFIDTAEVRSVDGLGVNAPEVYPNGRHLYLKGFFNALESWRLGCNIDGWKLNDDMLATASVGRSEISSTESKKGYPAHTRITSELLAHVEVLLYLFSSESLLTVPLRLSEAHKLQYIVGDASTEGFLIITQYLDLALD